MARIEPGRMTSAYDGDVVVFLIGMRINSLPAVREWLPMFRAMPAMLRELLADRSLGCLGARSFLSGRTLMVVQYWAGSEQLMAYAHDTDHVHRPEWAAFNRRAAASEAVGIFHETYVVPAGGYETVYRAVPAMGLAAATQSLVPVGRRSDSARQRLSR